MINSYCLRYSGIRGLILWLAIPAVLAACQAPRSPDEINWHLAASFGDESLTGKQYGQLSEEDLRWVMVPGALEVSGQISAKYEIFHWHRYTCTHRWTILDLRTKKQRVTGTNIYDVVDSQRGPSEFGHLLESPLRAWKGKGSDPLKPSIHNQEVHISGVKVKPQILKQTGVENRSFNYGEIPEWELSWVVEELESRGLDGATGKALIGGDGHFAFSIGGRTVDLIAELPLKEVTVSLRLVDVPSIYSNSEVIRKSIRIKDFQ